MARRPGALGENIGSTPTHVVLVELKEPGIAATGSAVLGPTE